MSLPAVALPVMALPIVALLACTSAPARTALQRDLPALKAAIAQAEQQGGWGASGVQELAGAVLERELTAAPAPAPAPLDDGFPDVSTCAREVRGVLEDVAAGNSDYSAPAAVALIDAGFSAPSVAGVAARVVAARRAVGARAAERRRALMLHGDAAVRRAALAAALEGAADADAADLAALAEAARLDPDLGARALAIRALGRRGGSAAVLALVDVYATASPRERREVIAALALPASAGAGGVEQLETLAQGSGEPSLLAAIALEGHAASAALASATLLRAIEGGKRDARLLALAEAPWSDPRLREAIGAARKHDDPATRVLALWRVVEAGPRDGLDREVLRELERLGTDAVTPVGAVARAALARAGRASVGPALRADLGAREADRRTLAALSLLELKDWAGAARALGDDSPRVRRTVACRVLGGSAGLAHQPPWRESADGAPALVSLLLPDRAG